MLVVGNRGTACACIHQGFQFWEMIPIHATWCTVVLVTEIGCHAYDFSHHGDCPHYSRCPKCDMCLTDIASCHEEIFHIARIEASVGYSVCIFQASVYCSGFVLPAGEIYMIDRVGEMKVYAPCCRTCGILVIHIFQYVFFFQYIIAHKAP